MSDQEPQLPPPPGWYPDAEDTMRWWDGQNWTAQVAPPASEPASKVSVGRIVGGVVLLMIVFGGLANTTNQNFAGSAEAVGYFAVPVLCLIGAVWLFVTAFNRK